MTRYIYCRVLLIAALSPAAVHKSPAADAIRFRDHTAEAGLQESLIGLMGHGAALGDFDADGRIDIFVGGFADRSAAEYAPRASAPTNKLFRGVDGFRFEPVSTAPVETLARTSGAVFADLNNDGTLELYVANNAKPKTRDPESAHGRAALRHSQLFRNDHGTFVDISAESGACPESLFTARNVGVFDYDNDGLLDLFLVEDKFTRAPRSTLLRNLGKLRFADVTREADLPENIFGLGLAIADLNDDGRPDFFVAHSNRLFLSAPSKRYVENAVLNALFHHPPLDGEDWPSGAAFGDLNRDGNLDLVVSAHSRQARNRIFLHDGVENGIPRFRETTAESGLGEVVPAKCPHVEIQDFDNDGWPDIYVSAAWVEGDTVQPLIYRHGGLRDGIPRFVPIRKIAPPMRYFPAGPSGDIDGDGRLDLFLVNWFRDNFCRLLRNETRQRSWLQVAARGTKTNRMGLGARVTLYRAGAMNDPSAVLGCQEIATGFGYASGQPAVCHFGLGDVGTVDVRVRFPNGATIERRVPTKQVLTVEEP